MARSTTKAKVPTKEVPEAGGGISDAGGEAIAKVAGKPTDVPGPSFNPATNLIIQDIAIRAGGRLIRHAVEKGMLRGRYGGAGAKAIVENRSLVQTLATSVMARYATRSLPGALLVGSGLFAKTLYDRSQSKRSARRAGDKSIKKMAD